MLAAYCMPSHTSTKGRVKDTKCSIIIKYLIYHTEILRLTCILIMGIYVVTFPHFSYDQYKQHHVTLCLHDAKGNFSFINRSFMNDSPREIRKNSKEHKAMGGINYTNHQTHSLNYFDGYCILICCDHKSKIKIMELRNLSCFNVIEHLAILFMAKMINSWPVAPIIRHNALM